MTDKNPHDKVAKNILGRRETAISFLKSFLPEPIARHLDIDSMKFEPNNFIPDHLKEFFSDILISLPVRNRLQRAEIYVLLEHKSYPDEMVILQILRYMVETWSAHELKNKRTGFTKLPMLIPIVIAHGEYEWRFKKTLSSVVDVPSEEFLVYLPDFQYALFDINVEDIRGYAFHSALKALFSIWKIRFNREVINDLKEAMMFLLQDNNLDEKQVDQFLKVLVHYVSMIRPSEEYPEILEMVKLLPAGDATMQTIADMLKEEGKIEGKLEGKIEGKLEGKIEGKLEGKIEKCQDMLIKALKLKFDIVKPSLINKIQSIQSVHVLDNLFELAFKASSIEEFTGYLNQVTDA